LLELRGRFGARVAALSEYGVRSCCLFVRDRARFAGFAQDVAREL
jgi:hypothetical protein